MFPTSTCIVLTLCSLQIKATILPSCSSAVNRNTIGCFDTDDTLLTPVAQFTYVNGYVPDNYTHNTLQQHCALQCISLGTPYYVLYNDSTCACVSVSGSLTLTNSSNCLTACPNTSISGSQYCPTTTPSTGAYWFCTPYSYCDVMLIANGYDTGWVICFHANLAAVLEGEYALGGCMSATDCLQQRTIFKCVNGSWNSLGQASTSVCQPCSQSPTVCSGVNPCNPTIPYGTCTSVASTTTTTALLSTTGQSLNTTGTSNNDNLPWYGGNRNPLPSQKIYTLVNSTNYDSSDRPTDSKLTQEMVTRVSLALTIQNIDSISELSAVSKFFCFTKLFATYLPIVVKSFGLDMFFYLSWVDPRLAFNDMPIVGPPGSFFQLTGVREQQELWIPPVYVGNSKATEKVDTSKHTSVVFLNSDGLASSTYRSFITAECKMNLQRYPFDTQICPIYLGVFGYYDQQVQLNWTIPTLFNVSNPSSPFSLNEKISLAAWTVVGYSISVPERRVDTDAVCATFRSCLLATITLRRKSSFYVIDTFLPSVMIMVGSCFTLWINPENVPARVSMAVTLFLTFQATSLNVRSKLPSVTYVKAIDIWLFFGQGCLFCVMAEFLLLHAILNGYLNVSNWRIRTMFSNRSSKGVQTEKGANIAVPKVQLKRQQAVKNIEKVARVLFPTVISLFAIIYFSVYLSQ